ncbi:MAG: sulfite exporter TauE/SafE family protein, partial [Candidatus Micrarchaeota archaeon]
KGADGVWSVKSDYASETTEIQYDEDKVDEEAIRAKITELGYSIGGGEPLSSRFGTFALALGFFTILGGFYLLFRDSIDLDFTNISMEAGFAALFAIGFLTGFHCIGMCGGFVLSYSKNLKKPGELFPHLLYGSGKTLSYAAIGALFGLLGSFIAFTTELRGGIAILAGIFLVLYGLNMLNIFPALRNLQLRLPSFMPSVGGRGPFVTGLLNGFMIACGPLQAMYIFAAGTGSPLAGAQALFFFGLGTLAPMITFGIASNFLSAAFSHNVVKFSGILVVILGLAMATNGLNLLGVGFALPLDVAGDIDATSSNITIVDDVQIIKMEVTAYGWQPNSFVLKKGVPVRWEIDAKELNGCNNEIIVRDYGLDIKLKKGLQVVEFTPDKEGVVRWSCWMGMIPGQFVVVDDAGDGSAQEEVYVPELPAGSTCGGGCGCGGR